MNRQDRFIADPNICHAKVCVKGTRVMVSIILDNLASGVSVEMLVNALRCAKPPRRGFTIGCGTWFSVIM